jgi:hypothetical protein
MREGRGVNPLIGGCESSRANVLASEIRDKLGSWGVVRGSVLASE